MDDKPKGNPRLAELGKPFHFKRGNTLAKGKATVTPERLEKRFDRLLMAQMGHAMAGRMDRLIETGLMATVERRLVNLGRTKEPEPVQDTGQKDSTADVVREALERKKAGG